MAWYSLYLWFSSFRKSYYPMNMISWYKKELHEQWFNNLSEEDKQKVLAYREEQKKKDRYHARQVMLMLGCMSGLIYGNSMIYNREDLFNDSDY